MEYKVEIRVLEVYVDYVEAESEEEAESIACSRLANNKLDIIADTLEIEVERQDA